MTDIREEFEAWHHAEFGYCISEEDDAWNAGECAKRWETWQASRAALKVELPDWEFPHYSEVVEALQQAGIEVKQP
ncbi:hypothetical protein [Pseudomonas citronellolis]|uniref:hypothetical protein n=1 Tax=Pseudomonas citronellolis TaxID=53408 RepID=UPI00389B2923